MFKKDNLVYIVAALVAILAVGVSIGIGFWISDAGIFDADEPRFALDNAEAYPTIYDYQGNVRDIAWLYSEFGPVELSRTPLWDGKENVFRLTEIRAQCDYSTLKVCVEDEAGNPINGVQVVRYWPGAPALPDFSSVTQQWTALGVYGPTEGYGCVGFGMGSGDYYYPPNIGVGGVYPADSSGPADYFYGLGMIGETNHCHLDMVYTKLSSDEPVPPTPTPGPTEVPSDGEVWELNITVGGTIEKK